MKLEPYTPTPLYNGELGPPLTAPNVTTGVTLKCSVLSGDGLACRSAEVGKEQRRTTSSDRSGQQIGRCGGILLPDVTTPPMKPDLVGRFSVVDGDNGIEVQDHTKNGTDYRVALDTRTVDALRDHRSRVERLAQQCETSVEASSFVFSYEVDGANPWRPDGVTHRWMDLRDRLGMPGLRLHDVRHFMATTMLTGGVPVSVVSGRLGHARAATALNVYSHFVEAGDHEAADLISDMLDDQNEES